MLIASMLSPMSEPPAPPQQSAAELNEQALTRQLADGAAAKALANQALAMAESAGDLLQQAFAHLNLSLQAFRNESIELGTDHLEIARQLVTGGAGTDSRICWLLEHVQGTRLRRLGRWDDAAEALQALHERAGTERPALDAYLTLSSLAVTLGMGTDRYAALARFYEALALARRIGEPSLIVNALNNIGSLQFDLHNLEDSLPLLEECLAGAIAIGSRRQTIFAAGNLLQCQCAMGLAGEALAVARGYLIPLITSDDISSLQRNEEIAYALLENGLYEEAEIQLAGVQRVNEMSQEISTLRVWLCARLLLQRGRAGEALTLCRGHMAASPPDDTAPPIDQVRLARVAAEAAEVVGDFQLAYSLLGKAYAVHEQLLGRAAKARFLSLQISHEVQRSAAERDAAQRTARDFEVLNRSLREQIAEIERLQQQLRMEAIEDPLTGLHNRRYLLDAGSGLLALALRHGEPLALALLDMDFFKQINDHYGHDAGDRVLCAFAQLARRMMRSSDVVCRYGGEEFVLLFALSDEDGAVTRLEAMQAEFRSLRIEGVDLTCTFSVGVSGTRDAAETMQSMLECADKALYAAKHAGRNRILKWSPTLDTPRVDSGP